MNVHNAATPWVEKYRPKSLSSVAHQTEVISTLQNAVRTNRLPHLLFYGPPGTGKTSVALALCRTLWHPDQLNRRVLEMNASDERGISAVRDRIKLFAGLAVGTTTTATTSGGGGGSKKRGGAVAVAAAGKKFFQKPNSASVHENDKNNNNEEEEKDDIVEKKYPNPPFKIIILDEADTVTPDAQAALRRIIEAHSKVTRFILICNYVTRIIEPLASRCAKFRFQPLPPSSMRERLKFISQQEHCRFVSSEEEDRVWSEIMNLSRGDMRRAVTTLQSAHTLSLVDSADDADDGDGDGTQKKKKGGVIVKESISEMAGLPPPAVVADLIGILEKPSFDAMEQAVHNIHAEGFSSLDVLKELLVDILAMENVSDMNKATISIRIAEADKHLVDGADEVLQLLSVCSLMQRCLLSSRDEKGMRRGSETMDVESY